MIFFKIKHYFSFVLEFKNVEIDFDLFQEAITFKILIPFVYVNSIRCLLIFFQEKCFFYSYLRL